MRFYDQNTQQYGQPTRDDLLQTLKPIETRYNGYRFRSRIEARWAVLFDALGVKYEYEKEGFELICGPYLPDFWLPYPDELNFSGYPNAGHWLEVKGIEPNQDEISKLLHLSLATNHTGNLVWGLPWNFKLFYTHNNGNYGWFDLGDTFDDAYANMFNLVNRFTYNLDSINEAIEQSKSARFEYGEQG
jgi:hypothetical protein